MNLETGLKEIPKMGKGRIAKNELKTSTLPEERIIFIFVRIIVKSVEGEFKEDSKKETEGKSAKT